MRKRTILALFLFCFGSFCLVPGQAKTQDIDLEKIPEYLSFPQQDAKYILSILFDELNKKWIDWMTEPDSIPQEQAVLVVLRQALRKEIVHYVFWEIPKQASQEIIKIIYKTGIIVHNPGELKSLLDEFEKMTVNKAKEFAVEWLLQREMRVAAGNLSASYKSCSEKIQALVLPYIIVYEPLSFSEGRVGISFYSSQRIEPPFADGSYSIVFNNFWFMQDCQPLLPFIVQIKGKVEKTGLQEYRWQKRPEFFIEFPDYVPQLDFSGPSFLDKIEQKVEEQFKAVEKVFNAINDFSDGVKKEVEDLVSKTKDLVFQAIDKVKLAFGTETDLFEEVAEEFSQILEIEEIEELPKPEEVFGIGQKETEKTEIPQSQQPEKIISQEPANNQVKLLKIQEQLGDIAEQIGILAQKIAKLQEQAGKKVAGQVIEKTEAVDKQEEAKKTEEKPKEKKKEETPVFCQKFDYGRVLRNRVIFNEIAWMGTNASSSDEWIELKNITNQEINLSGWQILDKDNQIKIIFARDVIPSNGFLLLERTDDNSAPYEKADLIYTGALDNQNEALYLFNSDCRLEDMVRAEPDWPAGDNKYKKTMERSQDLSWHTGILPEILGVLGTPKRENTIVQETGQASAQTQYTPHLEPSYCSYENFNQPLHFPVILNEIAWMGSKNSSNDEWIELKNISDQAVSLQGWQLQDNGLNIAIIFNSSDVIEPGGFFLLERTDDESAPDVLADKIYTGSLNNQDEFLRLFNNNCFLIDEVLAQPNWPAGDNSSKRTMERSQDFSWHTFSGENGDILATPKKENSQPQEQELPKKPEDYDNQIDCEVASYFWYNESCHQEPQEQEEQEEEQEEQEPLKTVVINEISWMGTKAFSSDEWIELYNNTQEDIDLAGWTIKAEDGTPEIILEGIISASGFYLLERTDDNTISDILADQIYTGALTNEGEILRLKDGKGNLIDKIDCSNSWFAGQNEEKTSMERIDSLVSGSESQNWANNNKEIKNGLDAEGQEIFGTPKAKNSVSQPSEPELIWDHCQGTSQETDEDYEQVLLSMIGGVVESFETRTFIAKTEKGRGKFYINANTRLFDQLGQKLSDQEGFSFADYLKALQEIKILFAEYGQICLSSEIWLK